MENLFKAIIGEQLSSVEFVQDYLQLHFDGNTLAFYEWPEINLQTLRYQVGDMNYRNALCKLISHKIIKIDLLENDRVEFFFEEDSCIKLNLVRNESNSDLSEFLYFNGTDKEWFVLE